MKNYLYLAAACCISLVACSSSSSTSGGTNETVLTGVFLDSAVSGITYSTNTQNGQTNVKGEFLYRAGEQVTFSIGDLSFPPVMASPIVTPLNMSSTRLLKDNSVTNIATLLQSLDADANPENGIEISTQAVQTAASVNFNANTSIFAQDQTVINMIANSGSTNTTLNNPESAVAHLKNTLINANTFRWIDLDKAQATGLFEDACATRTNRFNTNADLVTSGSYDDAMRRPGYNSESDAVDQITGESTNYNELEQALDYLMYDYTCLLITEEGRKNIVDLIEYFAQRDMFQRRFENEQPSGIWFHTVTGTIKMWAAVKPYVSNLPIEQANLVENWFGRRIDELIPFETSHSQNCNVTPIYNYNCGNQAVIAAYSVMLYGAVTADAYYFNYGVDQYENILSAFRADGSLPEDTRRGCRVVAYLTVSMSVMTGIAEIGLHHGIDLYSRQSNGITLSDGVKYLIAVKDDNSIVVPYANVDGRMEPNSRDGCPGGAEGRQVQQDWSDLFPLWHWALRHPNDPVAIRLKNNWPDEIRSRTSVDLGNIPYLWSKFPGY